MPWEQEWHVDAERYNDIRTNDGPDGRTLWTNMDATDAERQLAAAAPNMARALMDALEQFRMQMDGDPKWHRSGGVETVAASIETALRTAGVLP